GGAARQLHPRFDQGRRQGKDVDRAARRLPARTLRLSTATPPRAHPTPDAAAAAAPAAWSGPHPPRRPGTAPGVPAAGGAAPAPVPGATPTLTPPGTETAR